MKPPKRRATFSPSSPVTIEVKEESPVSSPAASLSPRSKKKRSVSISPVRRKSSSEEVRPPPEFRPFHYKALCPTFFKLVDLEPDETHIDRDQLLDLQYELEAMLGHGVDFMRRATGEVTYLNTGDYPTQDFSSRPVPMYRLHQSQNKPGSPNTVRRYHERGTTVAPNFVDDINLWPPPNITARFWTWCRATFLKPYDDDFLELYHDHLIERYSPNKIQEYLVNEPWKYIKRPAKKRVRITSNCSSTSSCAKGRRRSSIDETKPLVSILKDDKEEIKKWLPPPNNILPIVGEVVSAVCREMHLEEMGMITPQKKPNGRYCHSYHQSYKNREREKERQRELGKAVEDSFSESEKKAIIKTEPEDIYDEPLLIMDEKLKDLSVDTFDTSPPRRLTPMCSPRIKKEEVVDTDDEDDDECGETEDEGGGESADEGSVASDMSPPPVLTPNGKINGFSVHHYHNPSCLNPPILPPIVKRMNGEVKKVNGFHHEPHPEKITPILPDPMEDDEQMEATPTSPQSPCSSIDENENENETEAEDDEEDEDDGEDSDEESDDSSESESSEESSSEDETESEGDDDEEGEEEEDDDDVDDDDDDDEGEIDENDPNRLTFEEPDTQQFFPILPEDIPDDELDEIDDPEDEELDAACGDIGRAMVRHLIDEEAFPSAATEKLFQEFIRGPADITLEEEGRDSDDEDIDDLARQMLNLQVELRDLAPHVKASVDEYWEVIKGEYAFHQTNQELNDADQEMFKLASTMFTETPPRKPTAEEIVKLRAAILKRNKARRIHHFGRYRRKKTFKLIAASSSH